MLELLLELLLHMHALSACHESLSSAPQFPIEAQWAKFAFQSNKSYERAIN